jgi:hypothetical protein
MTPDRDPLYLRGRQFSPRRPLTVVERLAVVAILLIILSVFVGFFTAPTTPELWPCGGDLDCHIKNPHITEGPYVPRCADLPPHVHAR